MVCVVWDVGCVVWDVGCGVWGVGCGEWGLRFEVPKFWVHDSLVGV